MSLQEKILSTVCIIGVLAIVVISVYIGTRHTITTPYDISMTPSKAQRIQNCDMPQGWKIITDGRNFSWETESGYRSLQTFDSPLDVCLYANTYRGFFKRNWKYLK